MAETESPADRLRKRIAEERNVKFAALEPFREVIQTEIEMGTPQLVIIRNLKRENVSISRYIFALYLQRIGLTRRRKRTKPRAVTTV